LTCSLALAALVAGCLVEPGRAEAAAAGDYASCQVQGESQFRAAIEGITLRALERGVAGVDYQALVSDQWRRNGIDALIDRQVDEAVAQVGKEEGWSVLKSIVSKDKATELATTVAERVYRSEAFKSALELTAGELGNAIGKRIEVAASDAAEPAAQCMRAFLGPRYGHTIARVVGDDTRREFEVDALRQTASVGTGQVLIEGRDAITGTVILIMRRQMARIVQRIGTRIVGSVLSRVVSVAAGGVGVVLIAKDVWDFRNGALPIIAGEMKSKASKEKVQIEVASAVKEQMGEHLKEIAGKTAERVTDIWQEFRRAHAKVLELAEKHAEFKSFIDSVPQTAMPRLDQLTGLVLGAEGEPGVLKRIADGSLSEAIVRWPEEAVDIARDTRSLAEAARWVSLAGRDLSKVVAHEIHRRAKAEDFSRPGLTRLLELDDRLAVSRLAALARDAREPLFELAAADLRQLARTLSEQQLESLGRYLTGLKSDAAQRILRAVSLNPQKMQSLARSHVREGVLRSADQAAAVDLVLRAESLLDLADLPGDVRLVLDGRVSPLLMWERHPIPVVAAALLALLLLRGFGRLFFGGGRRRARA
jgi:hypothetical protein